MTDILEAISMPCPACDDVHPADQGCALTIAPVYASERAKNAPSDAQWLICDLDGTLSDCAHRVCFAQERRWADFHSQLERDAPVEPVLRVLRAMAASGVYISLCTGRPDQYATQTLRWLATRGIPFDELRMRPHLDYGRDVDVKPRMVPDGRRVLFVMEDRERVVAMWRERGFTCFHVAEGGY